MGAQSAADGAGIFAGLKILELGAGAAGPVATRYFADQGATVVRVESARRPDFLRMIHKGGDNDHGLDGSPMFVLMNPNKKSVAINLALPEGVALLKRLIGWADVVSENFSPKAMAKWGLDHATLCSDRPDLILVSSCLFGQTGPQRMYPGFGGQGAAISGFNHLTGWADRDAVGPYGTITDSLSPRYIAVLIAAALYHRKRTGQGQYIDVSQIETAVYSLSEMIVRFSASGEVIGRRGNECEHAAPHGVYPCRGEDRWIAIATFSDDEWRALCCEMGEPGGSDPASDPRFRTMADRLANRDALDERIAAWTRGFDAHDLMRRLQAAGVEAGAVQRFDDLLADPQLVARGHFEKLEHVHLGELAFEYNAVRCSDSPQRLETPGPNLGEHTRSVLREALAMDSEEIDGLAERGVLV
jgi:benzylsuccinate CoA-transferase BbsF subunit